MLLQSSSSSVLQVGKEIEMWAGRGGNSDQATGGDGGSVLVHANTDSVLVTKELSANGGAAGHGSNSSSDGALGPVGVIISGNPLPHSAPRHPMLITSTRMHRQEQVRSVRTDEPA